jgi:nicotinamidase/pyrazinamidase
MVEIGFDAALIVVDVQVDFLPGGALAVPSGHEVIAPLNAIARRFHNVVLTQDWHPPGHVSFASSHHGKSPLDEVELEYGVQVLWPDHCVQGLPGALISSGLHIPHAQLVLRKGFRAAIDSYSAFREADRKTSTGLAGYLRERGIGRVFLAGLATDFCVSWTALDARQAGFECSVIEDACRAIDHAGSLRRAWAEMTEAGVQRIAAGSISP